MCLFFLESLLILLVMMAPGFVLPFVAGLPVYISISLSPILSIALFVILGCLINLLGISVSSYFMFFAALTLSSVISLFVRHLLIKSETRHQIKSWYYQVNKFQLSSLMFAVGIAVVVYAFFFLFALNDLSSINQYSDNVAHLNKIRTMASQGCYSVLNTHNYPNLVLGSQPYFDKPGFYPAAFNVLAALVFDFLGQQQIGIVENATIFFFLAIVFPLSNWVFINTFLKENTTKLSIFFCIFASVLVVSFPLSLLLYGPLFPNMAAYTCVPASAAVFILATDSQCLSRDRLIFGFVFLFSLVSLATLQPNSIFVLAVLLGPYCCVAIYKWAMQLGKSRSIAICFSILFLIFAMFVWITAYKLPFFKGVVSFHWDKLLSGEDAFKSILDFSFRLGVAQPVLGLLVLLGAYSLFRTPGLRWYLWSYLLMAVIYIVDISTDGLFKQLLSGFWYTDPYRTAAGVGLFSIPLIGLGLNQVSKVCFFCVSRIFRIANRDESHLFLKASITGSIIFAVLLSIFVIPSVGLGTHLSEYMGLGPVNAFRFARWELRDISGGSGESVLSQRELDFATKIAPIVGDDVVLNNPFDGSVYLYSLFGVNTYYKSWSPGGKSENSASRIIRNRLDRYYFDPEVHGAVSSTGAKYLLLLNTDNFREFDMGHKWSKFIMYPDKKWSGFERAKSLPSNAAELIMSDGDLRLYRLE